MTPEEIIAWQGAMIIELRARIAELERISGEIADVIETHNQYGACVNYTPRLQQAAKDARAALTKAETKP